MRPEPKRRTAKPACSNAHMDTGWVRTSCLGGRDWGWSTFGLGGLAGRGPDVATWCNPGRGAIFSRPQLASGDQGHYGSSVVPSVSTASPVLLPPLPLANLSLIFTAEYGTPAELSGSLAPCSSRNSVCRRLSMGPRTREKKHSE